MNKDKQILEMAKDLSEATRLAGQKIIEETKAFVKEHHRYHSKNDFDIAHEKSMIELEAEYLIAKGYRKAEYVAREIFEEIGNIIEKEIYRCDSMRDKYDSERIYFEGGRHSLQKARYWIAELKKKYT